MNEQHIQIQAADTILRKGVRVPVLAPPLLFRIFGKRRMSITLRQPSFNGLLIISRLVVEMGLSPDEFKDLTTAECYKLIDRHGEKVAQIIAVSVLRWPPLIWGYKRFARWMGWRIEPALLAYALHLVLTLNDAGDFISSIRSVTERLPNLLSPRNQGGIGDE